MVHDDEIIDLADLPHDSGQECGPSRRSFCLGAGAAVAGVGLITLGVPGCGAEDPRIGTGGIDNVPPQYPDTPDMASKSTGSTTSGTGSTTSGTGSTTSGTGSTTSGTGSTTSGTGSTTSGTGSTTSGTGSTTGGTTGSASCATSMVAAGATSAVAVGKAKRIRSGSLDAWLCHDANGFYALDNYCPHRGCTVSFQTAGSFYCGCHGATFDFNGKQTNRESPRPMDHLSMCVDTSGNAFIDPQTTVDPATRN